MVDDGELQRTPPDTEDTYARRCRVADPVVESEGSRPAAFRRVEDDVVEPAAG
jgi:hypothetical protein